MKKKAAHRGNGSRGKKKHSFYFGGLKRISIEPVVAFRSDARIHTLEDPPEKMLKFKSEFYPPSYL